MMSLVYGSWFSSLMAFTVFQCFMCIYIYIFYLHIFWFVTVISKPFMSGVNIDEPGFTAPTGSAPPSSDSSGRSSSRE